jgi:hypothetical protein
VNARIWLAWLILLPAILFWEWRMLPSLPSAASVAMVRESWRLPKPRGEDLERAKQALETRSPWRTVQPAETLAALPPKDPDWRILGVMARGNEKYLSILVEGEPGREVKVGDLLPGGSKLLDIGTETICVLVNGQKRQLNTFECPSPAK